MPSIAGYVRYSSDRQKETSVDDQIHLLTELTTRHGWPTPRSPVLIPSARRFSGF